MQVAILDIETTRLEADTGFILCACYKLLGKKEVKVTRIDESKGYKKCLFDDTKCIEDISKWIEKDDPDILITYNGEYFDVPYINTRLLLINKKPLPPFRHIDHWKTSRYQLKLRNHSLNTLAEFLKVPHQKTFFDIPTWQRAMFGSKPDLDKIVYHCKLDVLTLEDCHNRVKPLLKSLRKIL